MPKESGKEKMPLVLVELAQGAAKDTGERERERGRAAEERELLQSICSL